MAIKVFVFDDNSDRRDSLKLLLETSTGITFSGSSPDCRNALEDVKEAKPDLILMDIGMPGISGIEATRIIKKAYPQVVILIQTVFEDPDMIYDAIQAGASGYLLKNSPADKLVEGIREAMTGGSPMSPAIATRVLTFFRTLLPPPVANDFGLSLREKEVLQLLAHGKSYKMIADALNISFNTVNSHIKNIYDKLHVHSLGEAISKALQNRIVA